MKEQQSYDRFIIQPSYPVETRRPARGSPACLRNPTKYTDRIRSDLFSLPLEILFGRPRWLPGENKHFSGAFSRRLHARSRYSRSERRRARQIVGNGPEHSSSNYYLQHNSSVFPIGQIAVPSRNQPISSLSSCSLHSVKRRPLLHRWLTIHWEKQKKNVSHPKSRNPVPWFTVKEKYLTATVWVEKFVTFSRESDVHSMKAPSQFFSQQPVKVPSSTLTFIATYKILYFPRFTIFTHSVQFYVLKFINPRSHPSFSTYIATTSRYFTFLLDFLPSGHRVSGFWGFWKPDEHPADET